jgi:sirohydrochlorin ferrochelatase
VEAAFASIASPTVPEAIERLRRKGATRIAVSSWFLAPGLLPDKVASLAGDAVVARPLGDDVEVAQLVLDRYDFAVARQTVAA